MAPRARKIIVLGLDGAVPWQFRDRALRGEMPNLTRLIERGMLCPALPLPSGVTPVNWLSIATGAYPGTHGVSEFAVHIPGTPLTESTGAFSSEICQAEFIWDALGRQGMRTAAISYPGSLPRTSDRLIAIGNDGAPGDGMRWYEVSSSQCVATADSIPDTENTPLFPKYQPQVVEWRDDLSVPWRDEPGPGFRFELAPGAPALAAVAQGGRLTIGHYRDDTVLCELCAGEWSPFLRISVATPAGEVEAAWRFYLTDLERGRGRVILYISPLYPTSGFSEPASVSGELVEDLGPYSETLSVTKCSIGWYPPEAFLDECRQQLMWQAGAALQLTQEMDVPLVFTKWHAFDKLYHSFMHNFDPVSPQHRPEGLGEWSEYHAQMHRIADRAVGEILDGMDDETALMVASDHGLMPAVRHVWINNALRAAGLIEAEFDEEGRAAIDWSGTRAYCAPFTQVWVNLIGRDPDGCVASGAEYEAVRDEVIATLHELRDPETGEPVMDEVFRVEDGAFYGLWGERDGDVRFSTRPGYSVFRTRELSPEGQAVTPASGQYRGDHGCYRPTARLGEGSETAVFGACGAGIVPGGWSDMPIKLTDVTPTICRLLDIEPPRDCEGAVVWRCLER